MGFSKKHLVNLLWILVVQQNCLRTVNCQEDDSSRCLPQKTFFALLHLPEVGSNLAAYSRMARVIQAKICLPSSVYVELFNDPVTRGHLDEISRPDNKYLEDSIESAYENRDLVPEELVDEKRSLATLAKNGDLPASLPDRPRPIESRQTELPAGFDSLSSESVDGLMKILADGGVEDRDNIAEIAAEYTLPNGELDLEALARDYPATAKRNVAALARDYALPIMNATGGKRNYGSVVRQNDRHWGKRNVGALARDWMLPSSGKRDSEDNWRSSYYLLPEFIKRNLGSIAGLHHRLRFGRRNIGSLARSRDFSIRTGDKRNIAALARNGDIFAGKRNVGALARDWSLPPQNRYGRSLTDQELNAERFDHELQKLGHQGATEYDNPASSKAEKAATKSPSLGDNSPRKPIQTSAFEAELTNAKNDMIKNVMDGKRLKRDIDYTDEYAPPVFQSNGVFDYENFLAALADEYPNMEKRFMGTGDGTEFGDRGQGTSGFVEVYQPSKRHIGTLARHGWLRPVKATRFSRSPRYVGGRKDPADGTASDYSADSPTRTLIHYRSKPMIRYLQSLHRDCRHGFRTSPPLPLIDNAFEQNFPFAASNSL